MGLIKKYYNLFMITLSVLVIAFNLRTPDVPDYMSGFSSEMIAKLKSNVLIVGPEFFTDRNEFDRVSDDINRYLDSLEPRYKAWGTPKVIDISIVSGGGRVSYYEDLVAAMGNRLRAAHVRCYVGVAGSMAFTFMLDFCDERIFFSDTIVMQHQVFMSIYGIKIFTRSTVRLSHKYSDLEADRLGIPRDMWWAISREQGDKFFSPNEQFVYRLKTN